MDQAPKLDAAETGRPASHRRSPSLALDLADADVAINEGVVVMTMTFQDLRRAWDLRTHGASVR